VVLIKRMIFWTNTTPAAATASAFPSSAEEGKAIHSIEGKIHTMIIW